MAARARFRTAFAVVAASAVAASGVLVTARPALAYSYRYCKFSYGTSGNSFTDFAKCYSNAALTTPASVTNVNFIDDEAAPTGSYNDYNQKPEQYWSSIATGQPGGSGRTEFQTNGFAFSASFAGNTTNQACSTVSGTADHTCTWDNLN